MYDQVKHNKDELKIDDYLSALMDRSKNLRSNIDIYNDKLKGINSKFRWLHIHLISHNFFFFFNFL